MDSSVGCADLLPVKGSGFVARLRSHWSIDSLSRQFWTFFVAAFFFDFGVGLYFFLFNLFLLNIRFDERTMGIIGGALMMGNVLGTIPVGILAQTRWIAEIVALLLHCVAHHLHLPHRVPVDAGADWSRISRGCRIK